MNPLPARRVASSSPDALDPATARAIYAHADRCLDARAGGDLGLTGLLAAAPPDLGAAALEGARRRYAVIRRFQQATLDLFRASLRGQADPALADAVLREAPADHGVAYHRALTDRQHRPPVYFRTDELPDGRLTEIQCPGSGWCLLEQVQEAYDAFPSVFGPAVHFPERIAARLARALREHLGPAPVVHHLIDNASRPHGMRYLVQCLREQGIRFFGYDRDVAPEDCTFVRAHDFVSLVHHNFFRERLARCERGGVAFDLPPSVLFDQKLPLAWPFEAATRDAYDDEVRTLFPRTCLVGPAGLVLKDGERVSVDDFCALPARRRAYYLKYAGPDVAVNWGSRAVYLASTFSGVACRALLDRILAEVERGRAWVCQEAVRREEPASSLARDGSIRSVRAYAKPSSFYGPGGLLGILVMQRRSHKVHGSDDTVLGAVR